ncbi:methylated-DNA--protein-cysteine methyltransferase [Spirochaetia bacterium]|nr:methylated-DNA--protein-cysteine methyltransferase [Spirochaetia bacterium]
MTIYTCSIETPLGAMTAAAEDEALTGLWFVGQKYYPAKIDAWIKKPDYPVFEKLRSWLGAYFEGKKPRMDFPLKPQGTAFQKSVWEILLQIPYGEVTTYGEIAKQLARKQGFASMSAQAVGGAVGHNPISVLIPCHRVLGADGSLTGYAGGLDKKKYLLKLEGRR